MFESVEERGLMVVKRIIGVPGDTISMVDNVVHLNGRPFDEPYVIRSPDPTEATDVRMRNWQSRYYVGGGLGAYRPSVRNWGPLVVPPDSFMMMGDNRDDSHDSRVWGFLGRDRIRGRAVVIYYSYDRDAIQPLPFLTATRWGRIFTLIR